MKKHVCQNCGKEIPVDRKYCSSKCNKAYKRRESYKQSHELCLYNDSVECGQKRCSKCGWNPDVMQNRIDRIVESGVIKP